MSLLLCSSLAPTPHLATTLGESQEPFALYTLPGRRIHPLLWQQLLPNAHGSQLTFPTLPSYVCLFLSVQSLLILKASAQVLPTP